jgi:cell division protein FtsB
MKISFSRNHNSDALVLVDGQVQALAKECEGWGEFAARKEPARVSQEPKCSCDGSGLVHTPDGTFLGHCGEHSAHRMSESALANQPVENNLLTRLLDSVEGNCYMGKEWELDTCQALRKMSPPDYEALKSENEALKLRVTDFEYALDDRELTIISHVEHIEMLRSVLKKRAAEYDGLHAENIQLKDAIDACNGISTK